jgi:hypothetical protein
MPDTPPTDPAEHAKDFAHLWADRPRLLDGAPGEGFGILRADLERVPLEVQAKQGLSAASDRLIVSMAVSWRVLAEQGRGTPRARFRTQTLQNRPIGAIHGEYESFQVAFRTMTWEFSREPVHPR